MCIPTGGGGAAPASNPALPQASKAAPEFKSSPRAKGPAAGTLLTAPSGVTAGALTASRASLLGQ